MKCIVYLLDFHFGKFSKPASSMDYVYLRQLAKVPVRQARSQGGFEGVRTNPLIFKKTAAVQGTIIQPCSGIVTDGIQAIMQLLQGVVAYTSPIEAFAVKSSLIA